MASIVLVYLMELTSLSMSDSRSEGIVSKNDDNFLQNITRRIVLKFEFQFKNYGFEFKKVSNGSSGEKRYTLLSAVSPSEVKT